MTEIFIDQSTRRDTYVANGGETEIPFNFAAASRDEVIVKSGDDIIVDGIDYSIPIVGEGNSGTVILDSTAYPSGAVAGTTFTIYGFLPIERQTDFTVKGSFTAVAVNFELDQITKMLQELRRDTDRKIGLSQQAADIDLILPTFSAGKALVYGYDSGGNPIITTSAADITGIEDAQAWALTALAAAAAAQIAAAAAAAAAGVALGTGLTDADLDTSVSVEATPDNDTIIFNAAGNLVATLNSTKIDLGRGSTPNVPVDILEDSEATSAAGTNGALRVQGGMSVVKKIFAAEFHGDGSNLTGIGAGWVGQIEEGFYVTLPTNTLGCDGLTIGDAASGADHEHADYETLFDILKTFPDLGNVGTESFAGGDTVNLPDKTTRVSRGEGGVTGDLAGKSGGASSVTLGASNLPTLAGTTNSAGSHFHSPTTPFLSAAVGTGGTKGLREGGTGTAVTTDTAGSHSHAASVNAGSPNTPVSLLQPYLNVKAVIRYA